MKAWDRSVKLQSAIIRDFRCSEIFLLQLHSEDTEVTPYRAPFTVFFFCFEIWSSLFLFVDEILPYIKEAIISVEVTFCIIDKPF